MLHFNNPGETFATRCDVIYKTLLRDCRKYFTDSFKMKSMRKAKKLSKLGRILDDFVNINFAKYDDNTRADIRFYLGCLVYPKEMISTRIGLYDENCKILKGNERAKKVRKIKELHNFLYNFSMEKCEKFFSNSSLCIIFKYYMGVCLDRIDTSPTMSKNKEVYWSALKLISIKTNQILISLP